MQAFTARTIELDPSFIFIVFLVGCVYTSRIIYSIKLTRQRVIDRTES